MAISVFSVGRDTQLVVVGPAGTINLAHVTAFESRQVTQSVRVNRLDGNQMGMELPKGWEGSFDLERGDSVTMLAGTGRQWRNENDSMVEILVVSVGPYS